MMNRVAGRQTAVFCNNSTHEIQISSGHKNQLSRAEIFNKPLLVSIWFAHASLKQACAADLKTFAFLNPVSIFLLIIRGLDIIDFFVAKTNVCCYLFTGSQH